MLRVSHKFIVIFHIFFISFFDKIYSNNIYIEYLYFFIVQILRYKIIYDLGKFWTTKFWLLKNQWLKHGFFEIWASNYIVVFLEVILVCLFFNDLNSLILFATVNSILLGIRIFYEEKANKFRLKL